MPSYQKTSKGRAMAMIGLSESEKREEGFYLSVCAKKKFVDGEEKVVGSIVSDYGADTEEYTDMKKFASRVKEIISSKVEPLASV